MRDPRVSFVVPTYNYGRFVARALDGLLGQSFASLEVIVIDDASTDESQDILQHYRSDSRVRLFRHEKNLGHIKTYNEGLTMARGEFVGLLSADDACLDPDAVRRQVALFDADPDVAFVYSSLTFIDESDQILLVARPWAEDGIHDGLEEFPRLIFSNYVPSSGPLVRATCHQELGYYDERLPHSADWDLWLRLSARHRVGYIAGPLYGYRRHGSNMHHRVVTAEVEDDNLVLVLTRAFDGLPGSTASGIKSLRRPALRAVAVHAVDSERQRAHKRQGWRRAVDALRQYPELLASPSFAIAIAKLATLTLVGRRGFRFVSGLRRRYTPFGPKLPALVSASEN